MATVPALDIAAGDAARDKRLYLAEGCFEFHDCSGQGGAMNYPAPALAQLELPVEPSLHFCARRQTTCRTFP